VVVASVLFFIVDIFTLILYNVNMKVCYRCQIEKEDSLFSISSKNKDKLQSYCKKCAVEKRMQKYNENRDGEREYKKQYSKNNSIKLKKYKESLPCADCGIYYPSYVTDFDHIFNDKSADVSNMMTYGWQRIFKEIKKCELVCANCHRERTYKRKFLLKV
jgi:hypothetical protein